MPARSSFDYAIVRVVPRVDREEFINAGVILFSPTRAFLAARVSLDRDRLVVLAPHLDPVDVEHRLALIPLICSGDPLGGPIAELPLGGRFHWLVAPRSTVIQTSTVHAGLCDDPEAALVHMMETMVSVPA